MHASEATTYQTHLCWKLSVEDKFCQKRTDLVLFEDKFLRKYVCLYNNVKALYLKKTIMKASINKMDLSELLELEEKLEMSRGWKQRPKGLWWKGWRRWSHQQCIWGGTWWSCLNQNIIKNWCVFTINCLQ